MQCTACGSTLCYKGGENKEDFGCPNGECPPKKLYYYTGNVKVRHDWYFSPAYHLPVQGTDGQWYAIVGPRLTNGNAVLLFDAIPTEQSVLQRIGLREVQTIFGPSWQEGYQEDIITCPYMALPVNEDFNREFKVLAQRLFLLMAYKDE